MPVQYDSFKFDYSNSKNIHYYKDLEKLSKNRWGRSLVVRRDGRLKEVGFIKTFFNQFRKKSIKKLTRLRVMHFIAYGIKAKLLNDQNNLSRISDLAKRAGIIDNLQKLHDQNSLVDDVVEEFYDAHQAEYKSFEEKHRWIHDYTNKPDANDNIDQRSRNSTINRHSDPDSSSSDDGIDPLNDDDVNKRRKNHPSSDNTNASEQEVPNEQASVPPNASADRNTGSVGEEEEDQDSESQFFDGLNSSNDQPELKDEEPSDNPPSVPPRDDDIDIAPVYQQNVVDYGPPPPLPYREPEEISPENHSSLKTEEESAPSHPPVLTTQEDDNLQNQLNVGLLGRRQAMEASIGMSQSLEDSVNFFARLDRGRDTNAANSDGGNPIASARAIIDFTKRTTEAFQNFEQLYEVYLNSDKNDHRTALLYEQVMNALRDVNRCIDLMADYLRKRPLYERGMSEVISNPKLPNYVSNKTLNEQMKNSFKKLEAIQQKILNITSARRYLSENQPVQAADLGGLMDRFKEQPLNGSINGSWSITESMRQQDD